MTAKSVPTVVSVTVPDLSETKTATVSTGARATVTSVVTDSDFE